MRKRSKYRPKPVRFDVIEYAISGVRPLTSVGSYFIDLKIKNHHAMTQMAQGAGTRTDVEVLVAALNMAEALAKLRVGKDWAVEIEAGQEALRSMLERAQQKKRFLFTGPELGAVNLAIDVHDAQLEAATVAQLEKAIGLVTRVCKGGGAKVLPKTEEMYG
jgi:hypothetical protein